MSEEDATASSGERPGEPVRYGEGAEGFPHGSKYPLFVGMGMFLTALGLLWLPVLVIGVPVLLYGIGGWTWEYTVVEFERGIIPEQKRQLLGIETGLLSAYVFIAGEILIFLAAFVSWFYLRAQRHGSFPPAADLPAPNLTLGAAMTATMVVGSLATYVGRNGIQDGRRRRFLGGFALTTVAGIVFLALLGMEYSELLASDFDWTSGPYGSTYFLLTGLHALHLVGGLAMLGVMLARAWFRDHFSPARNLMPRTTEVYWHFLTFVSVLVLVFVYMPLN